LQKRANLRTLKTKGGAWKRIDQKDLGSPKKGERGEVFEAKGAGILNSTTTRQEGNPEKGKQTSKKGGTGRADTRGPKGGVERGSAKNSPFVKAAKGRGRGTCGAWFGGGGGGGDVGFRVGLWVGMARGRGAKNKNSKSPEGEQKRAKGQPRNSQLATQVGPRKRKIQDLHTSASKKKRADFNQQIARKRQLPRE